MYKWLGVAVVGLALVLPATASAHTVGSGTFSCSASALRVTNGGIIPLLIEPSVANQQGAPCTTDRDAVVDYARVTPLGIQASVLEADTWNSPTNRHSEAEASVLDLEAFGGLSPLPFVEADLLQSSAKAECGRFHPVMTSESTVVAAKVGPLPEVNGSQSAQFTIPMLATVYFNREIREESKEHGVLTRRALEISTPNENIPDVVVAESVVDYHGNPCDPPSSTA